MFDNRNKIKLTILGSAALLPLLVLPVMVGALVDHLGLSESMAGWVASAGFFGSAVTAIWLAFRIHHLDLQRLAANGLAVMIFADGASVAAVYMPDTMLIALRAMSGIGAAAAYAAVMSGFARSDAPDKAYGLFMAMQFLLSALGLYLLPYLLPATGIEGLFLTFALFDLIALKLVGALPPRRSTRIGKESVEWKILLTPTALVCLLSLALYEAANMAHFTYADRLGVAAKLSTEAVGSVLGVATLLGIPAALLVTWIGDRFGHFPPLVTGVGIQCVGLAMLITDLNQPSYIVGMCMLGVGWAFTLPWFQAVEADIDRGGSVVVAGGFATSLGGFIGPAAAAMLVQPGIYTWILAAAIGTYILVIFMMLFVCRRTTTGLPNA